MSQRTNKRILYANQLVAITNSGQSAINSGDLVHGVQNVGISTNFGNTPYFELGALQLYEDVEELPDVQVTMSKIFDNKPFIYHLATRGDSNGLTVTTPDLAGRSNARCNVLLGIYADTSDHVQGTPTSFVMNSGMFISNIQYAFPVGNTFTESVTLVGNNKLWKNDSKIINSTDLANINSITWSVTNVATNFNSDVANGNYSAGNGLSTTFNYTGVERRQNLAFATGNSNAAISGAGGNGFLDSNNMRCDWLQTILPPDVDGISTSGTNEQSDGTNYDAHVQSITISTDLGRTNLNELGRRGPYHRYATFPVEVTCAVEIIATSGDMVSATEGGILATSQANCSIQKNLNNRTIRVATCHGEVFYLGVKNKLTSITYGGGDTGGGNATVTYNFRNYNVLTVMAASDPNLNNQSSGGGYGGSAGGWWNNPTPFLVN